MVFSEQPWKNKPGDLGENHNEDGQADNQRFTVIVWASDSCHNTVYYMWRHVKYFKHLTTQCTLLKCRNILELKYLENWQCVNFKQLSFFCTRTLLIIHWNPKKVDLLLFGTYAVWNYVFGHINNVVCPGQQFSTQNIYSLLV